MQRQMKQMDVIEHLYQTMSFSSLEINQIGDNDPVAELVQRFTKLAETVPQGK